MNDIVIFESDSHQVEVHLEGETVWLTQKQMGELFDKDVRTVSEHIGHVFDEQEVAREATVRKFRIVQQEGNRQIKLSLKFTENVGLRCTLAFSGNDQSSQ